MLHSYKTVVVTYQAIDGEIYTSRIMSDHPDIAEVTAGMENFYRHAGFQLLSVVSLDELPTEHATSLDRLGGSFGRRAWRCMVASILVVCIADLALDLIWRQQVARGQIDVRLP